MADVSPKKRKAEAPDAKKISPYQQDLDMVDSFERMFREHDVNAGDQDAEDAFVDWAQSEAVRVWVIRYVHIDIEKIPYNRQDYFRAPLFAAYHLTCEALERAGCEHKNIFL